MGESEGDQDRRVAPFTPEPGQILILTSRLMKAIEAELGAGKLVTFTIKMGGETSAIAVHKNLLSVSTRRNKEMEEEMRSSRA